MPKAIAANWELIRTRYIAGASPSELAKQYGIGIRCLNHRIQRGNWRNLRQVASSDVDNAVIRSLAKQSEAVRANLANALQKSSAVIDTKPGRRSVGEHASAIKTLAQASATVFGWAAGADERVVSVNVLNAITAPAPAPSVEHNQALDVAPATPSVNATLAQGDVAPSVDLQPTR